MMMDSYSELTDQLFVHRLQNWSFCSNYQNLNHSTNFTKEFECRGLIPINKLYAVYQRFFSAVASEIGSMPIIFLHFPSELDDREKFKDRHDAIKQAIDLVSKTYPNLHSIEADSGVVTWPENAPEETKDFPYHYNQATYSNFAKKIRELPFNILPQPLLREQQSISIKAE